MKKVATPQTRDVNNHGLKPTASPQAYLNRHGSHLANSGRSSPGLKPADFATRGCSWNAKLAIVALLGILLLAWAQSHYKLPLTSDAFERSRVAEGLQAGVLPQTTAAGGTGYNYPLLFDFLLASLSALLGLPSFAALNVLSLFFGIAFAALFFILARQIAGGKAAVFAAGAALLSPLLFYRTVTPISETFGVFLFLLAVFAFLKKNNALCFFVLATLAFSHYRSLSTAVAVLFFLSIFQKRFWDFAKTASLPSAYFALVVPKSFGIANPWVIEPDLFVYFTPVLLAIAAIGKIAVCRGFFDSKKREKELETLKILAAFFLGGLVFVFFAPFAFRQLVYLVFPAALLAGIFFGRLEEFAESLAKKAAARFAGIVVFIAFVALAVFSFFGILYARAPPFNAGEIGAFSALKFIDGETVLAPFNYNYAIPYYSGKKVVVGAFAEGLPDGQKRIDDLRDFFHGASSVEKRAVVEKYGAKIICLDLKNYSERNFAGVLGEKLLSNSEVSCFKAGAG